MGDPLFVGVAFGFGIGVILVAGIWLVTRKESEECE